ncbi:MAG: RnfABCDGE type electron transport complex subunit D, partial [Bacteroidales bacterium]|nr:RnfABCDGE type electron transport complex subunit D [Bacteroidales bacterium]
MNNYTISGSPHVHGGESTKKIMYSVIIALMPAFLFSIYYFGFNAVRVTLISVAACVLVEWLIQKYLIKGPCTIADGSAIITGMLLAFNLPSNIPAWMIIIGSIVAIGIGKMSFGGLGNNPFNPALVGRVFMLISFPVAMTTWPTPQPLFGGAELDALTGPTL